MATNAFEAMYERLPDYIRSGESNVFSEKSVLWEELFGQRDNMTHRNAEEALENFLSPRSNQATGTAAWHMDANAVALDYIDEKLEAEFFSRFQMPLAGSPSTFEFRDRTVSMPYLWRFLTFQKTYEALAHLEKTRDLDIVEIGAGYGCVADLWMQTGRVRSYTIVDLPENLVNSAYYLANSHPEMTVNLVDRDLDQPSEGSINLLTPGHIRKVVFCGFDLAVNSDSLGEMPKVTAQNYVDWLSVHLAEGGVFFTKNGHRRGYDNFGVPLVSNYGYEKLTLMQFGPGTYCTSAFDDFSHVAIMKRQKPSGKPADPRILDLLANLYATGLSTDLIAISNRFVENELLEEDLDFLSACEEFFHGRGMRSVPKRYDYLRCYLDALQKGVELTNNIGDTIEYLKEGQSDVAVVYSSMFWKYFREESQFCGPNIPALTLYSREFDAFDRDPWPLREIKYRLRFDALHKKIRPYQPTRRSTLLMAKNLFLNFKQRKKFSVQR